jgi:hypothetical protein
MKLNLFIAMAIVAFLILLVGNYFILAINENNFGFMIFGLIILIFLFLVMFMLIVLFIGKLFMDRMDEDFNHNLMFDPSGAMLYLLCIIAWPTNNRGF